MELINQDPFQICARDNEQITVTVMASGTEHRVGYSLNDFVTDLPIDQTIEFRITGVTELAFTFDFSCSEAGLYKITLQGDPPTDISEYVLYQSPAASSNLVYQFYLAEVSDPPSHEVLAPLYDEAVKPTESTTGRKRWLDFGGDETKGDYG